MFCNACTLSGGRCRRYPLAGKRRQRLHSGCSTGPKTLPPKNFGAMQAGRHRAEARRALSIWLRRQVAQADSAGKTDLRPIEALQAARRG